MVRHVGEENLEAEARGLLCFGMFIFGLHHQYVRHEKIRLNRYHYIEDGGTLRPLRAAPLFLAFTP